MTILIVLHLIIPPQFVVGEGLLIADKTWILASGDKTLTVQRMGEQLLFDSMQFLVAAITGDGRPESEKFRPFRRVTNAKMVLFLW